MDYYTDMPKISYLTALDFYMITCYGFVVFSILEFAIVHQDKFDYEEFAMKVLEYKTNLNKSQKTDRQKRKGSKCFGYLARNRLSLSSNLKDQNNFNINEKIAHRLMRKSSATLFLENRKSVYRNSLEAKNIKSFDLIALYENSVKISKIDKFSKILFPILFVFFNLAYFVFYTSKRNIF